MRSGMETYANPFGRMSAQWVASHSATRLRWQRIIFRGSVAYLLVIIVLYLMLFQLSERWWFSSALTFLPRLPWILPALILGVLALKAHRPSVVTNVVSAGLVLGPIMGLNLPLSSVAENEEGVPIRVVTGNVQNFSPDFAQVFQDVSESNPDIVAFQEITGNTKLLEMFFEDWHMVNFEEFWIGSRYPLRLLDVCESRERGETAIAVEVELPTGAIRVVSVHLVSPRKGLQGLIPGKATLEEAMDQMKLQKVVRQQESEFTRAFVARMTRGYPHVVMGDMNILPSSNLYQSCWGDYRNAFDEAGWGYGYTFPTTGLEFWPENLPWMRIDHILVSEEWQVSKCQVGKTSGSDHRVLSATLVLSQNEF